MSDPISLSEQKAALRKAAQAARVASARAAGPQAANQLARLFTGWPQGAGVAVVSGYLAIGTELDVAPVLSVFAKHGAEVALPVVVGAARPLEFRRWQPGMELEAGPLGTRHPPAESPALEPDLLLVPMLAFDDDGYRMGWGGGFYDRTLAQLRAVKKIIAVGIGYEGQRVDKIPRDDHDAGLDWIATESALHKVPTL